MKSSCYDCKDRHEACQNVNTCERYREYKNRRDMINSHRQAERIKDSAVYELKKTLAKKYAKTKKGNVLR